MALTFDDGPVADTNRLLSILQRNAVKATFFTVGQNVAAHPDIARREVREGHVVGNHSWNHPDLVKMSPQAVHWQLSTTSQAIRGATGVTPTLVRPPYGATNSVVKDQVAALGSSTVLWNIDTLDWKTKSAPITVQRALAAKPGSIILMHDIHPWTIDAVQQIITEFRARGYHLVTVPQLLSGKIQPGGTYFGR